jgi:hypothetical protein
MSVTYLAMCNGAFFLKDWKGALPPGHPVRPLMCWLNPARACTTQCAACSVEDLDRSTQRVHCKALWKAPCIGFLDEQDQLRAQLEGD